MNSNQYAPLDTRGRTRDRACAPILRAIATAHAVAVRRVHLRWLRPACIRSSSRPACICGGNAPRAYA
eukprot:3508153-Lingulodinium_polyedra.AAC.1